MSRVSPGMSRRGIGRGLSIGKAGSSRSLRRMNSASSSESFRLTLKAPSKRIVRKSVSGLDAAVIGSLGDPSRTAPARSKSNDVLPRTSQSALQLRRHSFDDAKRFDGIFTPLNGNESFGNDSQSFSFRSPISGGSRRSNLRASPSGGLIHYEEPFLRYPCGLTPGIWRFCPVSQPFHDRSRGL